MHAHAEVTWVCELRALVHGLTAHLVFSHLQVMFW